MSLPPEILKKVKLLEIKTRKVVNNTLAGEYHSAFKGQGMTFSEFREYVPGDDVRTISWPVTARTGTTFIKKFDEEREHVVMLVIDVSGSSNFGTGEYFKGEVMAHLSALLSFSASKNNDAVGLLLFSDQVEHFVPPKKGRGHVHRILRDIYFFKPKSKRTNISGALEYLRGVIKKKSSIFVFSDFFDDKNFSKALKVMGNKHDVVAVVVNDDLELSMPAMGLVDFRDAETGEIITVDTSSKAFRSDYEKEMLKIKHSRDDLLKKSNVDRIEVATSGDLVNPLISFFKRRNHR